MRAPSGSPSSGEFEVLQALRAARGRDGRYVPAFRVKRHFPKRVTVSQVSALLAGESSTYVQTDGNGNYRLTAAGATRARAHKPRRWIAIAA